MTLEELIAYVKGTASTMSNLINVATIESSDPDDPYRQLLIRDLRRKYSDLYAEFEMECIWDDKINPYKEVENV